MSADILPPAAAGRPIDRKTLLAAGAAATAALAVAYLPNLRELAQQWNDNPNYSHGFLVAPIAAAILWQRRDEIDPARLRPNLLGWAALLGLLAVRAYLFSRNERWGESATIPLVAMALALGLGGWHLLRWGLPGFAFLFFMLPLPPRINMILAGPLQSLATIGSTALLQALGMPVLSEGNVILVGSQPLEVARACNGLSMLLSFVTLITATAIMVRTRPTWERVVLLLSTVPIALVSNILRIAATAFCYRQFGAEWGERIVHDTAGWAMMPIALVLVMLELRLLSWLVVAEELPERPVLVLPQGYTSPRRPIKKKPAAPGRDDVLADGDPEV